MASDCIQESHSSDAVITVPAIGSMVNVLYQNEPTQAITCDKGWLMQTLANKALDTGGDLILPRGLKYIEEGLSGFVAVYEFTPRIWNFDIKYRPREFRSIFRWGKKSRSVSLALPYVLLVMPIFKSSYGGCYGSGGAKCVFMTKPFTSMDDIYCSAVLDNILVGNSNWMCLGSLEGVDFSDLMPGGMRADAWLVNARLGRIPAAQFLPVYIKAVVRLLEQRRFNDGYDFNLTNYGQMAKDIPGIYPYARWQRNSRRDSGFGLKVQWPSSGRTMRSLVNDAFETIRGPYPESLNDPNRIYASTMQYLWSSQGQ